MGIPEVARVLVVGLGESGVAAARLAHADGAMVAATDSRSADVLGAALDPLPPDTELFLGGHPLECLEEAELVLLSPGVPSDIPLLQNARMRGLPVMSEMEFAWRHREDAPLVAVTGSNGKSTVTTLVAAMLKAAGRQAVAGGNLGPAASQLVLDGGWDCWVLEVSSFQAESLVDFRPDVGLFLNLSQDHLERHPDMGAYAAAKRRIFANQGHSDVRILNADDGLVAATAGIARPRFFSIEDRADACLVDGALVIDGEELIRRDDLAVSGLHNIANALAASLAAVALKAPLEAVRSALLIFSGLPHRHQVVCEADGIRWIDDSKATNVGAALAALSGYAEGSVHLILGGLGKGQDFSPLAEAVRRVAARVYLIGRDAAIISNALGDDVQVDRCETLERAVELARNAAETGQVVVLAPACASFDQFSGYPERGRRFTDLARAQRGASCP